MVADNVSINVSGLVGTEQQDRGASVSVLVAFDSANNTYIPLTCSPEGYLFTSGVN